MEADGTTCSGGESPPVWGAPLLRGRQRNKRAEEQKDRIEAYWQCKVMSEDCTAYLALPLFPKIYVPPEHQQPRQWSQSAQKRDDPVLEPSRGELIQAQSTQPPNISVLRFIST